MTQKIVPSELTELIYIRVWSGFYSFDEILTDVLEGLDDGWFSEEELDLTQADVEPLIREQFAAKFEASKHWPAQTECDLLADAFAKLTESDLVSLENAGHDQSDGWTEDHEFVGTSGREKRVRGGCFYHYQDLERAVTGTPLYLTFGSASGEEADNLAIGKEVVKVLQEFGLKPTWNGTTKERIVLPIDWKRR